ncbi:Flavinator of succinate dehydrogenase domain containing protein [Elaphomyces granulatus]
MTVRFFRVFPIRSNKPKDPSTTAQRWEDQKARPLNLHTMNSASTQTNVGENNSSPGLLSSVDPEYELGKIEHLTGAVKKRVKQKTELGVGEMEGIAFKVKPLRREEEDVNKMKARLLYQSRKRGILETDLLLSTFADAYLADMTVEQLRQYDIFLDENDWDIYYWATQEPSNTASATSSASSDVDKDVPTEVWKKGAAMSGEWAQTVGAFKPAYRPVPSRWAHSEILALLRKHVDDKSVSGFQVAKDRTTGGGLGRMPNIKIFSSQ